MWGSSMPPELSPEGFLICTFGMMCICSTTFVGAAIGSSGFTIGLIVSLGMLFEGGGELTTSAGGGFRGLIVIFGELGGSATELGGSFIIVLIGSRFRLIFSGSTFRLSSERPMTPGLEGT
uniref:(northern house mosquito) hypothetical protein n=1 Tax=Culex pipiens TaxID=7175 RepID=A0A8D8GNI8_CULPI